MAVTARTILNRCRRELRDLDGTNYSDQELVEYLSQAVRMTIRHVALVWADYYMRSSLTQSNVQTITSGTANYNLPTDFWVEVLVTAENSDGDTSQIFPITFERTLDEDADGYYLRNDDMYLYPEPDATVASGLTIYYVAKPAEVTVATAAVPLADDFEDVISEYVVLKGKARQGEPINEFASFYTMLRDQCIALGMRINRSDEEYVLRTQFRIWS